jgi:VCBS repeat-containing protein
LPKGTCSDWFERNSQHLLNVFQVNTTFLEKIMPNNNNSIVGGPTFDLNGPHPNYFDFLDWLNGPMGGRGKHNDDIVNGNGNNAVNSGNGIDIIYTAGGDDDIHAGNDDDTIIGGIGDDSIFGGNGFDTVVFSGSIVDFTWGISQGNRLDVQDLNLLDGDEGTDSMKQVEALQFDDFLYVIDGDNAALVVGDDQTTDEDTALTFGVSAFDLDGDVLSLDSFSITSSTGATLSFTLDSTTALSPSIGTGALYTFTLDPQANYQFLGAGEDVQETVSISVSDGNGNTTNIEVAITIEGVNDRPVALDDTVDTTEDFGIVSIDLNALVRDVDINDSLTITMVNAAGDPVAFSVVNGIVSINTSQFDALGDSESASFDLTYTVQDDSGAANNTQTGTVTVNVAGVNDAPVAPDLTLNLDEDSGVLLIHLNALVSDVDVNDNLTITMVTASGDPVAFSAVNGVVSIDTNQFNALSGTDSATFDLSYTVKDDSGTANDTASGTVTVNVAGLNDAPTAPSLTLDVTENVGNTGEDSSIYSIDLNALIGDVDAGVIASLTGITPSGDPVVLSIVGGVVTFDTDQFEALGIGEGVSFDLTYTVQDDSGAANDTSIGVITVNVAGANDAPVVVDGAPVVANEADGLIEIDLTALALDVDTNDVLSYSIVSITDTATGRGLTVPFTVTDGILSINPTGFGLDLNDILNAEIIFAVSDGTASVNGSIPLQVTGSDDEPDPNEAPVANNLTVNAGDEALVEINLNALVMDADAGDVLTITGLTFRSEGREIPIEYTLLDGVVTFDPAQFSLADGATLGLVFDYAVKDDSGAVNNSASGAVNINLTGQAGPDPENTAPVAANSVVDTDDDVEKVFIDLNALVSDPDGDTLSIGAITFSIDGVEQDFSFELSGGVLCFDPSQFGVPDQTVLTGVLSYTVDDSTGTANSQATGEITLNVTGIVDPVETNNAPVTNPQSLAVDLDVSAAEVSFDLAGFAFDLDPADVLAFSGFSFTYDVQAGEGSGITTFDVTYASDGTVVTFDPTQFGLLDGEVVNASFFYTVDDGSGAANSSTEGSVNVLVSNPEGDIPFVTTSYLLDFEPFADELSFSVPIASYEAFTFAGDVQVYETDETGVDPATGREIAFPAGVLNGVVSGDNVLAMLSDGNLTITGLVDTSLGLITRPTFNLDSINLTSSVAASMIVTFTTFKEGLVEVDNGFGGTTFVTGLVELAFDFVVGTAGPLFVDFNSVVDPTAFDAIASVEITTNGGSENLLIIDDLAVTLQTEPIYNLF